MGAPIARVYVAASCETGRMSAPPTLVLDSASLYFRSFFALPESMTAPDGRPHNAVRGFLSTLTRLVAAHGPTAVVAAWDADWRPAWRVDLLPTYKTHRLADPAAAGSAGGAPPGEMEPESLGPQALAIDALLTALGIAVWGVPEHEADDVVASVAAQVAGPVIAVSGDRDLVQVVSDSARLLLAVNGGMEKWPLLDPAGVRERFGVDPSLYVDLAVLRGDPSDGIPGVPGIGAKTAAALVGAFGGLEEILAAADATPAVRPMTARLAAALRGSADEVRASRVVATARPDLELPGDPPPLSPVPADADRLASLTQEWGVQRQVADLQKAIGLAVR